MRYWIAAHYPHATAGLPWFIYFRESPIDPPQIGDSVHFYETRKSLTGVRGKGAIVWTATVSGTVKRNTHGDHHIWKHVIECVDHRPLYVPLSDVMIAFGESPFYRRTLTLITKRDFDAIAQLSQI